jgi:hypothetical protein
LVEPFGVQGSEVHRFGVLFTYLNLNGSSKSQIGDSMKIERFEDIDAWQLARELTRKVYELTKKAAFERDFGLKRQTLEL